MIYAVYSTLPGTPMTLHQAFPYDSPQTDHATQISQEAALISENVVIWDHAP